MFSFSYGLAASQWVHRQFAIRSAVTSNLAVTQLWHWQYFVPTYLQCSQSSVDSVKSSSESVNRYGWRRRDSSRQRRLRPAFLADSQCLEWRNTSPPINRFWVLLSGRWQCSTFKYFSVLIFFFFVRGRKRCRIHVVGNVVDGICTTTYPVNGPVIIILLLLFCERIEGCEVFKYNRDILLLLLCERM